MNAPSAPLPKKRKHSAPGGVALASKKQRKEHSHTDGESERKKDKGKGRAKSDMDGEFEVISASLVVSIAPVFAANPRAGVEEMLDSMVMRYIPAFQGVVLAHTNLQFSGKTAAIKADCPFAIGNVTFDATVWSPQVGTTLVGRVNICSPDHISLLVHRTFNVSIPRHHIPADQWEFEYGPAENDPEFGPDAVQTEDVDIVTDKLKAEEGQLLDVSAGRWVHHLTREPIGGPDGYLEFTVIGFTVANEMLSLLGSIQVDPFSPEHVPETRASPSKTALGLADEEEEESVLRMAWADEDGDVDEGPLGEGEEEVEEEDDQEMELKRQKKIAKKARSSEDFVEKKEKKKRKISSSTAEGKSTSGKEHRKGKRTQV